MAAKTKGSSKKAAPAAGKFVPEKIVWSLESALFHIDELICGECAEEDREHIGQAVEALIEKAKTDLERFMEAQQAEAANG